MKSTEQQYPDKRRPKEKFGPASWNFGGVESWTPKFADGTGSVKYQDALAAIFIEGWIFIILSVTGARQYLIKLLPRTLALSMSAGKLPSVTYLYLQLFSSMTALHTAMTFRPTFRKNNGPKAHAHKTAPGARLDPPARRGMRAQVVSEIVGYRGPLLSWEAYPAA